MEQAIWLIPMVGWLALCGSSVQPLVGQHGVGVIFDGGRTDNIFVSADRRAHHTMVRYGMAG